MKAIFDNVSLKCSKLTTNSYSTSFSLGIYMLSPNFRDAIYSIYGYVRFADEIVDSFHGYKKSELLNRFKQDTYNAIEDGISLNPILNSFQHAVTQYNIDIDLINAFLKSMEMDLHKVNYTEEKYNEYIYGSAEVVGLMCLKVFCNGNKTTYQALKPYAQALGSAFQKINFLRDYKDDSLELNRTYFPNLNSTKLTEGNKKEIEDDINNDFAMGYEGIKRLPKGSRFGVYVAYIYYKSLFNKVKSKSVKEILNDRIRIPNYRKIALLFSAYLRHQLNIF